MAKRKMVQQVPRNSLIWLLVAQVAVIAPLLWHVPLWIAGLWLVCAGWRVQVFRMRAVFPPTIIKAVMMVCAVLGIYLSRGSLVGLDAAVALLLTTFVLKLVELRSPRDALVLIYLGFFTTVTSYLFADGIGSALYSLLPVVLLLAALIGLQQTRLAQKPGRTLGMAGAIVLQAVPLTVLLFLFFPRLEPLWRLPTPSDKGVTGLSEQMSPGDIAELSQSAELVFRASFARQIPAQEQLYWRALTLPHFDGKTWRRQQPGATGQQVHWQPQGVQLPYTVIMQPSGQRWLYSLEVSDSGQQGVQLASDFSLRNQRPVQRTFFYQAVAWPQALLEPQLRLYQYRSYLQLPRGSNPQAHAWAELLRQQYTDDEALVQAVLNHFNEQAFFYTLKPPRLGEHSVDEFLFLTRSGFCEHYSSAMTFVLRAAGIPARVVTGYQGGEINQAESYVQVRQYDAHAWVEYWRLGIGWQRVDPTFMVAPDRIERGLANSSEGAALQTGFFSPLSYRHIDWLNRLRIGWDSLNHKWQLHVLGYQAEQQQRWLRQWLGEVDWQKIAIGLLLAVGLLFSLLALVLLKPWRNQQPAVQRWLQQLDRLLLRKQLAREPAEGLRDFQSRVAQQLNSSQRQALAACIDCYERHQYAAQTVTLAQMKNCLQRLRHEL